MAEVSVIIPVYNVDEYLSFCLDSVINQSFSDIEIICINDGSSDSSLNILQRYAAFDSRIKIINKSHGGLSSARNAGIDVASGEYLTFVDSDDYISPVLVENSLDLAKKYDVDYVAFGSFSKLGFEPKLYKHFGELNPKFEKQVLLEKNLPANILQEFPLVAWAKLYKTSIIKDKGLRFVEGLIYEDGPWTLEYLSNCEKILFTNDRYYFYRATGNAALLSLSGSDSLDVFRSIKICDDVLKKYDRYEKYRDSMLQINLSYVMRHYYQLRPQFKEAYFSMAKEYFTSLDLKDYNKKILENSPFYKHLSLFLSCNFEVFERTLQKEMSSQDVGTKVS